MNKDDRSALIELGGQFTPTLFEGLDAEETEDEVLIERIGQAFSQLSATSGVPLSTDEGFDPSQPSRDEMADWLVDSGIEMSDRTVKVDKENHRSYTAVIRPATIDDCLSWRLDSDTGELRLLTADGQTHAVAYKSVAL